MLRSFKQSINNCTYTIDLKDFRKINNDAVVRDLNV